jgi:hypothetical protein
MPRLYFLEGKAISTEEVDMLVPSQLVSGQAVNKLFSSSEKTSGSGAALQVIPKRTSRLIRVEVNSIDRDYSKYPLSSEFSWDFPFPVKEIREVRLIGGTIPVPYLNIDSDWNKFTFCEGSEKVTITIPVGFYTISSLTSSLQTQLNLIGVGNIYSVSQDPLNGRITISTSGPNTFYLLFTTGSYKDIYDSTTKSLLEIRNPSRHLGFGIADYTSVGGIITASRAPNLWFGLEKSYLYMNFDSSQDLRSIFRGSGRKEPSAIIYNDVLDTMTAPITKYLNKETFDTNIVPSPASLSRIRSLNIGLHDTFYRKINTQGRELSLLLELLIID